jgi:hypothetical protein
MSTLAAAMRMLVPVEEESGRKEVNLASRGLAVLWSPLTTAEPTTKHFF